MKKKFEVIFDCQLKSNPLIMQPARIHTEAPNEYDAVLNAYLQLGQEDRDGLNLWVANVRLLEGDSNDD